MTEWIDYDEAVVLSTAKHGDQGRSVLHLSMSRGEIVVRADRWTRHNANNGVTSIRAHDLTGEIWRYAIPAQGRPNALRTPDEYRDDDGHLVSIGWQEEAIGIRVKLDDLQRMLDSSALPNSERPIEPPSRKWKDSRGAKADPRWEEVLIEAARYMYEKQEVGSQTDLINHVRQWLNVTDDEISNTAFKDHIAPLWRAFKKVDGG